MSYKRTNKYKKGFIYLISDGVGCVKIGRTTNWAQRFNGDFSPAARLILVASSNDSYADETKLHQMFDEKRVQGEWFALSENDIQTIQESFNDCEIKEMTHV